MDHGGEVPPKLFLLSLCCGSMPDHAPTAPGASSDRGWRQSRRVVRPILGLSTWRKRAGFSARGRAIHARAGWIAPTCGNRRQWARIMSTYVDIRGVHWRRLPQTCAIHPARACIARPRAEARFRNVDKTRSQEKLRSAPLFLASSFVHIAKTGGIFRARPRNTPAGGAEAHERPPRDARGALSARPAAQRKELPQITA